MMTEISTTIGKTACSQNRIAPRGDASGVTL